MALEKIIRTRLDEETYTKLQEYCRANDTNISAVIRELVSSLLDD